MGCTYGHSALTRRKDGQTEALREKDLGKRSYALLSLTKAAGIDPLHRKESDAPVNLDIGNKIFQSLIEIDWKALNSSEQNASLELTKSRWYALVNHPHKLLKRSFLNLIPIFLRKALK